MELSREGLRDKAAWESAEVLLPQFDISEMCERTRQAVTWVHFGAGNLFRAFPCAALQTLLDLGEYDRGVVAVNPHDAQCVDLAFTPYDNLTLLAVLCADGRVEKRVIASIAEVIKNEAEGLARLRELFAAPSLQMVSLTVTEKAYQPDNETIRLLCALLNVRFQADVVPIAIVSMDNCANNGQKLHDAVRKAGEDMVRNQAAEPCFLDYLDQVAFPNTMIDKITPHPDPEIAKMLRGIGLDVDIIKTEIGTITAPYVNAEQAEYLVIEDHFPNGRPPLEKAGIYFTDRETVDKVEKMKVGTCLNPLHTALALLGCLLGFSKISSEMNDPDIRGFVERMGYRECLPVVQDPGILSPKAFLDEVLQKRVNNPFLPDTPQRIASDTSQKLPVRFGYTIRATADHDKLHCVPFVIALWFRYLTGIDDEGKPFEISPDPRAAEVRSRMSGGLTDELLSDATLFGEDLVAAGLSKRVKEMFSEMMEGKDAVRKALQHVNRIE